ncbi:MAG TPA: hypothetical protein VMR86_06405 [Myxococcota bacterium]|nr:hypothetical protein [Myxococcota bacterium]
MNVFFWQDARTVTARLLFCWILLLAAPANAAPKTYTLQGHLTSITPGSLDPTSALAALGVAEGASVQVDWTVETTTPLTSFNTTANTAAYEGAVTALTITIGSWSATLTSGQNVVTVADDSAGLVDALRVATSGADTSMVLQGAGVLSIALSFTDLQTHTASSNTGLDQTPARYPNRSGLVQGPNGTLDFDLDTEVTGSGASGVSTPCTVSMLNAAAKFCQSRLKCYLQPRIQNLPKLEACVSKSSQSFLTALSKAQTAAQKKGLTCSPTDFTDQLTNLEARVNGVFDQADAINPANVPVGNAWLNAAGADCSAGLKAEAANVKKPDAAKLDQARAKAHDKLVTTAGKAVAKAEKKGGVFDPEPDPGAFADLLDQLIDDTVTALGPI